MSDHYESPNIDNIKEALTCVICQEVATLPVHSTCCDRAKSMNPSCLSCVRTYYELNKRPVEREDYKKAWGGCGCSIYTKNSSWKLYQHTTQLDMIRNLLGPSVCYHENCKALCVTTAELRRHLTGLATSNDKHGNCLEAITKCQLCNLYGKRSFINGQHYRDNHDFIHCDVCNVELHRTNAFIHYNRHCEAMNKLYKKVYKTQIINDANTAAIQ